MSRQIQKTLENCKPGDLVCVDWSDASTGKSSLNGGVVDVPVKSWGVFLGLVGSKIKHIILAQNSFHFTDSMFDLDYTAIPVGWTLEVTCIQAAHLPRQVVEELMRSFVSTGSRGSTGGLRSPRTFQHRMQRLGAYGRSH